ncbi:hypothetical protein NKJ46_30245 [Mesorhizobium sp. M0166]|uniref:hypothetical protein n=1 Tax=unclassified Mesorhizobium TaxID=325217 RepID=UPI00333BA10A
MFLDPLPQPFPHIATQADEGRADIFSGARLRQQGECRLARLALDAKQLAFLDGEALGLSQFDVGPLRYGLSARLETMPSSPAWSAR